MAGVRFKLVKNTGVGAGKEKATYKPVVVAREVITLDEVARRISDKSSPTFADVMSVVCALANELENALENGCIIDLGPLGNFSLSLCAKVPITDPEAPINSKIAFNPIVYRGPAGLRRLFSSMNQFERMRGLEQPFDDSPERRMGDIMELSKQTSYLTVGDVRQNLHVGDKTALSDLRELVTQRKLREVCIGQQKFFMPANQAE